MDVTVAIEDVYSPVARTLVRELDEDLAARYGGMDGDSHVALADFTVPRSACVVAWVNGEPAGCGAIRPMTGGRVGEIKRMYVRPAWRGKGISRRVLAYLETLAREFGYDALQLETGIRQPEAIGLYESSG